MNRLVDALQRTIFPFLGSRLRGAGAGSYVCWPYAISDPARVTIGAGSVVGPGARIELRKSGTLEIGDGVVIEGGLTIDVDSDVRIGTGSVIGRDVRMDTVTFSTQPGAIVIEPYTTILPNVTISGGFHNVNEPVVSASRAADYARRPMSATAAPAPRRHFVGTLALLIVAVALAASTGTTFTLWAAAVAFAAAYRDSRIVWSIVAACLFGLILSVPLPGFNAFFGDNIIFGAIAGLAAEVLQQRKGVAAR